MGGISETLQRLRNPSNTIERIAMNSDGQVINEKVKSRLSNGGGIYCFCKKMLYKMPFSTP